MCMYGIKYLTFYWSLWGLSMLWGCTNQTTPIDQTPSSLPVNTPIRSVDTTATTTPHTINTAAFPYDLTRPVSKFKLDKKLKEISGLSCFDDQYLAAVQDERGTLYILDIETGNIDKTIDFSADGDYEGITFKDNLFYVLRADGVLFEIHNWDDKKALDTRIINTNLGEINNTEGLVYHPKRNQLLIACKDAAFIGDETAHDRALYAYDLEKEEFDTDPFFILTKKAVKDFVKEELKDTESYDFYKKAIKKAKKEVFIKPSGIAIHPISHEYYILSAIKNTLLVLDKQKRIKYIKYLPKELFEQAEGITFNSQGDLFIASEGVDKKARIYKFIAS